MRVGFEMISAGSGFAPAAGGMTTYYEGLSGALVERDEISEVVALMPPGSTHMQVPSSARLRIVACGGLPRGRLGRVGYEHLLLPRVARRAGIDVLLCSHNVKPLGWHGPSVVVLQSMQYFFLPDPIGRLRRTYLEQAVPRSLRSADVVIAVSEAQRRDAIDLFDLDPESIVTVHHGASPWALTAARVFADGGTPTRPLSGERPYVLSVSSLYAMKNYRRLIEAFARVVREGDLPHELVIAGREVDETIPGLRAVATEHGVENRVRLTGAYPQDRLPALLANADVVAYVSLYETFGHPVLEAFAFGRPLVTSNIGGTAEIAGDAAILVDPYEVGSIEQGLLMAMADEPERTRLRRLGQRRFSDFSWEKSARGTAEALQRAANRRLASA